MWSLCIVFVMLASCTAESEMSQRCRVPLFYRELGCQPLRDDNSDCPSKFDCGNLFARDETKCYYLGEEYDVGDLLENDPRNPCDVACKCSDDGTGWAFWSCATYDCLPPLTDKDCYSQHSLDSCCAQDYCFSEHDDSSLAECEYNGETYLEGQYLDTTSELPCSDCICQPGFNGTLDAPWCRDVFCGIELYYTADLRYGCAPIYDSYECCPSRYRCPADCDSVIRSEETQYSEHECVFGDLRLNIGDKLTPSKYDKCVECTCDTPPVITCVEKTREQCRHLLTQVKS